MWRCPALRAGAAKRSYEERPALRAAGKRSYEERPALREGAKRSYEERPALREGAKRSYEERPALREGAKRTYEEPPSRRVIRSDIDHTAWVREKDNNLTPWHRDSIQVAHQTKDSLSRHHRRRRHHTRSVWEREWDEGWDWEPEWDVGFTDMERGVMVQINGRVRGVHSLSREEIGHVAWTDPHIRKALEARVGLIAESMRPKDIEQLLRSMRTSQVEHTTLMWSIADRILENYGQVTLEQLCSTVCLFADMRAKHYGLFNVLALALQDDFNPIVYVRGLGAFRAIEYSLPLMNDMVKQLEDPRDILNACRNLRQLNVDISEYLPELDRTSLADKVSAIEDLGILPSVNDIVLTQLDWPTLRVVQDSAMVKSSSSGSVETFPAGSLLALGEHFPELVDHLCHPRQQWPSKYLPRVLALGGDFVEHWLGKLTDEDLRQWSVAEHVRVARALGPRAQERCAPYWAKEIFRFNAAELVEVAQVGGDLLTRAAQRQVPRALRAQSMANRTQDNVSPPVLAELCRLCSGVSWTVWNVLAQESERVVLREGVTEEVVDLLAAFQGSPAFNKVCAVVREEWHRQTKVDSAVEDEFAPDPLDPQSEEKLLALLATSEK
eukprot:GEMP01038915.1.p1 GENE.GEMP01038915.1~~GEMP01038915.1.p1  ORF type:complete len:611 (+),score=151.69 GEMP01038915.1:51-1883(+)